MRKELVTHLDPKSPVSETFRTLRTNIQFMNSNRRLRSLLVTSTMPGEGKSWVASNLAVTFAQAGKRVALIDADMRKGRLCSIFGVEPRPGLSNYLSGYYENQESVNIDKYLKQTDVNNLYIIPAGNIPPNPSELLVRRQMRNLLEQLKNQVDLVIIDGTPSKLVTDSVILSRIVDSTLIVSAHNQTRKDDLERVIKDVRNVGGNVAGVVYNKIPVSSKKYNQTYYYSSNVTVQKNNQPDYEAERRKLQQRTQNALSQNSKRNGNHSETNNRNSQNTRQENTQVPKALRNNIDKDNWKKIIEEEKKEIFFGYVLQLCHVIKWLGEYINSNPNIELNKTKIKIIPLPTNNTTITGTGKQEAVKSVEEKVAEIPSIDSLIGTECNIMYNRDGKLVCGPYCKLESKYSSMLGKKVILKNIIQNDGKDKIELPYIVTEIEIVQ